jgi:ELWxxDGT repeat protein
LEARRLLAAALIRDINAATVSSEPAELVNVNGVLYFTADDGTSGLELWQSDGTPAGTVLVQDILPGGGSSPTSLANINATLFFAANDGASGTELWKVVGGVTGLVVSSFTPTSTGFTIQFSQPVDPSVLNLYDTQADLFGPADVTVTGSSTGPVRGSLVLNTAANRITFIQTDTTLPADTYTVVLRSAANGFRTPGGALLDGNGDGTPGDNYTTTFSVAPFAGIVVSVPDFLVGPGQPVNVPASSTGLPLRLSDGAGVTSVSLTLLYNPALLNLTGAVVSTGLPAGATVSLSTPAPGTAMLTFSSPTPLSAGPIDFIKLTAAVPSDAPYTAKEVLDLTDLQVNGGAIPARDNDGLHIAAYFGDATGNATYTSTDAARILRVGVGLDSGFGAFQLADPVIVADITGNGILNATNATRVLQEVIGLDRPEIAPLPGLPSITPGGPDPLLSVPTGFTGLPGSVFAVPVCLDPSDGLEAADIALSYDATRLEVLPGGVRRGTLTGDFNLFAVHVDAEAGTIRIGLGRSAGGITGRGGGSLVLITFRVRADAPAGAAVINLRHDLGAMTTLLNEGGLVLNPEPSNAEGDPLDGLITVLGPGAPAEKPLAEPDSVLAAVAALLGDEGTARAAEDDTVTRWRGDKVKEVTPQPCHPFTLSPCHLVTPSSAAGKGPRPPALDELPAWEDTLEELLQAIRVEG